MKANEYRVLTDCVDRGVNYGVRWAYKLTDTPTTEQIMNEIYDAVLLEICEYFSFQDGEQDDE
jgi:hypothetical protein